VFELDNRGSQVHLTAYWAQALANQTEDPALRARPFPGPDAGEEEPTIFNPFCLKV